MRFGTDGVRGVAYSELTIPFAFGLARAAAAVLSADGGAPLVLVGGDTRESTLDFDRALCAGFAAAGLTVERLGTVPTPVVAFEAQRRGALGAMISASHNPYEDNGIKLFARGGRKLADDVERRIEAELDGAAVDELPAGVVLDGATPDAGDQTAADPEASDVAAAYVDHVLSVMQGRTLDGLRVVVDTANGAAHRLAPAVLRAAGADVTVIADQPDGRNINAGCGATVPGLVADAVRRSGADVGVALDGDADRLIAVDHTGAVVDGDHILAIAALDLRARGQLRNDSVVVTVMTNLGFHQAMEAAGIHVVQTAVGDRYVLEALAAGNHSLGGEQSGHVIFADHATTGDGILTAVALLDAVVRTGEPLSTVARRAMTSLPQVLVNVRVAHRMPDIATRLATDIAAVEAELGDTGRVLVRASGTEALVRVMIEAPTHDEAQSAADRLAGAARSLD